MGVLIAIRGRYGGCDDKGHRAHPDRVGVLIAIRVPFAAASHAANYAQGLVIGELLLALAVTFAAQNAVMWLRATQLMTIHVDAG